MDVALSLEPDSDEALKMSIAYAKKQLGALESGDLTPGLPFEGRTEARIYDLKRKIAMWRSIMDQRDALRA